MKSQMDRLRDELVVAAAWYQRACDEQDTARERIKQLLIAIERAGKVAAQ